MNISIETAKNASQTCIVDGRFLHSKYNPENEAKSFVSNIDCNFCPSCIIITGASLPYTIPFFKEKFPNTPVYSIQYNNFFIKYKEWDASFLCTESTNIEQFTEVLYSTIGENNLCAPLVLSWKASENIFIKESDIAWKSIKLLLQKTRDIVTTRSYFCMPWLKNSIRFCAFTKNFVTIKPIQKSVLLVASGFSLKNSITLIKKNRNSFFILAVSSAICTLTENNIIPDLCISTDGGYYAKNHLDILISLHKKGIDIPLAISTESNVPNYILEHCPIVPLTFNDGIESILLNICKIPSTSAERNGTVSGTASIFAQQLTTKNVYACGLDLANSNGYSHCQPNAHEKINNLKDFRLSPLENRICPKPRTNELSPMDIYRQWFETRNESFSNRFFRLSTDGYTNKLGTIKDITWNAINLEENETNDEIFVKVKTTTTKDRKKILLSFLESIKLTDSYVEDIAYSEYLQAKKYPNSTEMSNKLNDTLKKRIEQLKEFCV